MSLANANHCISGSDSVENLRSCVAFFEAVENCVSDISSHSDLQTWPFTRSIVGRRRDLHIHSNSRSYLGFLPRCCKGLLSILLKYKISTLTSPSSSEHRYAMLNPMWHGKFVDATKLCMNPYRAVDQSLHGIEPFVSSNI